MMMHAIRLMTRPAPIIMPMPAYVSKRKWYRPIQSMLFLTVRSQALEGAYYKAKVYYTVSAPVALRTKNNQRLATNRKSLKVSSA